MERCCKNCEWSISPELECEIMEEQGYLENDFDRPIAGDCVLGNIPDNSFYCPSHLYGDGTEEVSFYSNQDSEFFLVQFVNDDNSHLLVNGYTTYLKGQCLQDFSISIFPEQDLFFAFDSFFDKMQVEEISFPLQNVDFLKFVRYSDRVLISIRQRSMSVDSKCYSVSFDSFCDFRFSEEILDFFSQLSKPISSISELDKKLLYHL